MKKLISIALALFLTLPSAFSFAAIGDYSYYEYDVYYLSDYDNGGSSRLGSPQPTVQENSVDSSADGKFVSLTKDGQGLRRQNPGEDAYGPDATGGESVYSYSVDAKWVGGLPDDAPLVIVYTSSSDFFAPFKVNSDGNVSYKDESGYTSANVKVETNKWYTFKSIFYFEEDSTYYELTVTDLSTNISRAVVINLPINDISQIHNKTYVERQGLDSIPGALLYVDNLKMSSCRPEIPDVTISPASSFSSGSNVIVGSKIKLNYDTMYCTGILGDNGGKVKIYNNGKDIGSSFTNVKGTTDVLISEGENVISASVIDSTGKIVDSSASFIVNGISLVSSANIPGYTSDFDTVSKGSFKDTSEGSYTYTDPDPTRGEGKVAYGHWNYNVGAGHIYSINRHFDASNSLKQGRFFEISADIKSNAPTNIKDFSLITLKTNPANPITDFSASSWTGIGFQILKSGEITCYNTSCTTGITADLNTWHNYKVIIDTTGLVAYYYIDDVLIYLKSGISNNIKALDYGEIAVPYDGINAVDLYLDNVCAKTYDLAFKATLNYDDNILSENPYENAQPQITFSEKMDSSSFSSMTLKDELGNEIAFTGSYDETTQVYSFNPLMLKPAAFYTINLSSVKTQLGAAGTQSLCFVTQKPPFSLREFVDEDEKTYITINNRTGTSKTAVLIVGCFDGDALLDCWAKEITIDNDRQKVEYVVTKDNNLKLEAYLIDFASVNLIDELFE